MPQNGHKVSCTSLLSLAQQINYFYFHPTMFHSHNSSYSLRYLSWHLTEGSMGKWVGGREVSMTRSAHALLSTSVQKNMSPLCARYRSVFRTYIHIRIYIHTHTHTHILRRYIVWDTEKASLNKLQTTTTTYIHTYIITFPGSIS
jgi:hypothetical protein